jgi:hypothetical protein
MIDNNICVIELAKLVRATYIWVLTEYNCDVSVNGCSFKSESVIVKRFLTCSSTTS